METTTTRGDKYTNPLNIGQRVHCTLYGGNDGIITDIQPCMIPHSSRGVTISGGSATIVVAFPSHLSHVPESIVRGVQWFISDDIAEMAEVEAAFKAAVKAEAEARENDRKAAEVREIKRLSLPERFPYLIPKGDNESSWSHGAKNIRRELKRAFPGVKFRVRSDSGSINVSWTDGPTTERVRDITTKYQQGSFDGMTDSYDYSRDPWPDVFGGAKYVFPERRLSDSLLERAAEKFGCDFTGEAIRQGAIDRDMMLAIYREAKTIDCTP